MAGVEYDLLVGAVIFLFTVWALGRLFRLLTLPSILGELFAGILLGPNFLDIVPYASDGTCDTVIFPNQDDGDGSGSQGSADGVARGRALEGAVAACKGLLVWTPRWSDDEMVTMDIWSFAGTVGVTLLIMESGMHINFEKVAQIGGQALVVALIGTAMPMVVGMLLVGALFDGFSLYPDGFSAGCALAPTSVGISIKLLSDAKMLNSMAGQTTLTAAFVDDVFSLVLLVLLTSLSAGNAEPGMIVLKTVAAFAFLAYGVVAGKRIYPKLDLLLSHISFIKGASIQPRDEVHLLIMMASLVLYAWVGDLIGSHLLGAFVAGMCFVYVPRSHQVWVTQLKRIIRWLIRIFFAATVGFAVPVKQMLTGSAFLRGLALGALPGILCKVVSGLPARTPPPTAPNGAPASDRTLRAARERAKAASLFTRFGIVQPIQYLVGMAMVARGEFAFLVAYSARNMRRQGTDEFMLSSEVYAALTWALVWALVFAPFLFKWALGVYQRATPIQRGMSIGGNSASDRNFVIQVIGQHHSGVLHEILNAIHGEGMDVLECRVQTDGDVDCNYFVVQSRGKQKDFDDEKLEDIRHHIQEILGDANAVVLFEAVQVDELNFSAIELQVVRQMATSFHGGRSFARTHGAPGSASPPAMRDTGVGVHSVVNLVTRRLQELGLDVEEMDEQHKLQIDHGHETEMEHLLFFTVPSTAAEHDDGETPWGATITRSRVAFVKKALISMLRDEDIKAEVVAKPVADRSQGFSELQTFNPSHAIARATGTVWEALCFGPHNVELLSTAVRKLAPLGVRLLHAAHSHARRGEPAGESTEAEREACSRFFVEKPGELATALEEEAIAAFEAQLLRALMSTYKTTDQTNFAIRLVDSISLAEMTNKIHHSLDSAVPGLQDLDRSLHREQPDGSNAHWGATFSPDLSRPRQLKQIPQRTPETSELPEVRPGSSRRASRDLQTGLPAEIEGTYALIEALATRVSRLEELELRAAREGGGQGSSGKESASLLWGGGAAKEGSSSSKGSSKPITSKEPSSCSLGVATAKASSTKETSSLGLPLVDTFSPSSPPHGAETSMSALMDGHISITALPPTKLTSSGGSRGKASTSSLGLPLQSPPSAGSSIGEGSMGERSQPKEVTFAANERL